VLYSANIDPELSDWLRWASESHEVPMFVQTVAEAAFLADLPNYALLRPVLLELRRQRPRSVPTETPTPYVSRSRPQNFTTALIT
jgi:hypothetical protein